MNAHEVIESYITDVAVQLPRKQRNDVAFELRALLNEELQASAEAAGRSLDAAMAIEFLRRFGRPEDVAARYRPTLTIVDPADGPRFLRASVVGLAIIWSAGLLLRLQQSAASGGDVLTALSQWWLGTVIPSMWWPGALVVAFGVAAWARRRWPHSTWKPRARDRIHGGRAAIALALLGVLCGLFVLVDPRWVLDFFWGGRAAPAAYEALTYTDTFLGRQAPWLLGLVALNVPVFVAVFVHGRWSVAMQRTQDALGLITCAVMVWTVLDGPIFMAKSSDQTAKFFMALVVALALIGMGIRNHRRVRPTPYQRAQA